VSRAGAPAQDDTFGDATGALTTPVQILSKPCPRYPEEALGRGLQGDVLLDVEFRYSGAVEVLGVRRGLGHGLNESAIEAARKMRFVPARRDGRPVDTQATLRIRFQLLQ
jgi:TonB family protein